MEPEVRKAYFKNVKRVVVKIGSGVLTVADGLNLKVIRSIGGEVCRLMDNGVEVLLVSSGAMASGVKKVGLNRRPDDIPRRQAVSAVGQAGLIMAYEEAFERYDRKVAQMLLTSDDLNNRKRYLNARNTLHTLLSWRVTPIINENDTVSVAELKFGDNDNLAALITLLMSADLMISLTNIDGLYSSDPRTDPDGKLIPVVHAVNEEIEAIASETPGALNFGGMLSKIHAAKTVAAAGVPMVIAHGEVPNILEKLFSGEKAGTFFVPRDRRLGSRKSWIGYTLKPKGAVRIDAGAECAILKNGKSLLPSGITAVEGDFKVGDPVAFKNEKSEVLGTGLVNYGAGDILKVMGLQTDRIKNRLGFKPYDEVIHRDNLVVTIEG